MELKFDFTQIHFDRKNKCIDVFCDILDNEDIDPSVDASIYCAFEISLPIDPDEPGLTIPHIEECAKRVIKNIIVPILKDL